MLTQLVLPAWQQRYAVLTPTQVEEQQLDDPRFAFVCVDANWGSIPFYTQRNDIVQLPALDTAAIDRAMDSRGAARVLMNDDIPLETLRQVLPAGTSVQPLLKTRRAVLVELSRPVSRPMRSLPVARVARSGMEAIGASGSAAAAWP